MHVEQYIFILHDAKSLTVLPLDMRAQQYDCKLTLGDYKVVSFAACCTQVHKTLAKTVLYANNPLQTKNG